MTYPARLIHYSAEEYLEMEYVIIHQDSRRIELHRKDDRGKRQRAILGENNDLVLESMPAGPVTLTMDDIYEDVVFPASIEEEA